MKPILLIKNKHGEIRPWLSFAAVLAGVFAVGLLVAILLPRIAPDVVYFVLNYAAMSAVVLACFKLFYKSKLYEMGLYRYKLVSSLLLGLAFGALSIAVGAGILLITNTAEVTSVNVSHMVSGEFFTGLVLFIMVGFFEELLCRGYMMSALRTTRNKYVVILTPSVIFALLHIANDNVTFFSIANITLVGVLFAYMFIKTGTLWLPVGFHIAWNFTQGQIFGIAVSGGEANGVWNIGFTGADWFTGGDFGLEGGAVCTFVILLGFLFMRFCVRKPEEEKLWQLTIN